MIRERQVGNGATRLLGIFTVAITLAHGSPPPFPDEMKYPNVVGADGQFGTFGTRLGEYNNPMGVAFLPSGEIVIADTFNNRIQILDARGQAQRTFGKQGGGMGELTAPHAVAVNSKGMIFVTDTANDRVVCFDDKGVVRHTWGRHGGKPGEFREPYGIAATSDRVFVADRGNQRVQVFTSAGDFLFAVGKYGVAAGEFDRPSDVTVDEDGFFYVADAYNDRIQKFDKSGQPVGSWGQWGSYSGLLATPSSVAYRAGRIYVADLINHRIQVFSSSGQYLYQWGRHPVIGHEGNGRMHYPSRIAVSLDGETAAVCEPFEHRCQLYATKVTRSVANVDDSAWWDKATRFHYGKQSAIAGRILTISEPDTHAVLVFDIAAAEQPTLIATLGGQGRDLGRFVRPSGMLIEPDTGRIHVSDGGNHRIQTFELQRSTSGLQPFTPNAARVIQSQSVINLGVTPSTQPFIPFNASATHPGQPTAPVEPSSMHLDKDGLLYLSDPHNSRILVLDKERKVVRTIGKYGVGPGEFLVSGNVAFSKDGEILYVIDTYNFRVQAFDRSGKYLFSWGKPGIGSGQFVHPFGIAAGKDGFVYVSDDGANRIQKFDEKGRFVAMWGRWGSEPGQFYKPKGISQSDSLELYVMDFGNHRGQVFSPDGTFRRMFGIPVGYTPPLAMRANDRPAGPELSNGGTFIVKQTSSPAPIPLNQQFQLRVTIEAAGGQQVTDDIALTVSANMPAHYHGMNTQPSAQRQGDGTWLVNGMLFHMPGHWKINYDIKRGNSIERAEVDVLLK